MKRKSRDFDSTDEQVAKFIKQLNENGDDLHNSTDNAISSNDDLVKLENVKIAKSIIKKRKVENSDIFNKTVFGGHVQKEDQFNLIDPI